MATGLDTQGSSYQPITVGEWIITFIITAIPLVGLIMMFVWAFGGGAHPSKKTWAQAYLILLAVGIVLLIIFFGVFATILGNLFSGYNQSV